jgi:hypothetical protein
MSEFQKSLSSIHPTIRPLPSPPLLVIPSLHPFPPSLPSIPYLHPAIPPTKKRGGVRADQMVIFQKGKSRIIHHSMQAIGNRKKRNRGNRVDTACVQVSPETCLAPRLACLLRRRGEQGRVKKERKRK